MKLSDKRIKIGKHCTISKDIKINVSDSLIIGDCVYIGPNVKIEGRRIKIGSYCYLEEDVTIGGGQSKNINSNVSIGKACLLCKGTFINNAAPVKIGNEVGIGQNVHIFTHGGFLSILDGYPSQVAPVIIGSHVWIPEKTSIYAGVSIGDNVVICPNSSVTKNIPSGAFAGGNPCRIIKEKVYPRLFTNEKTKNIIQNLINHYLHQIQDKGIPRKEIQINIIDSTIELVYNNSKTKFNFINKKCSGNINQVSEDFRDYLRRHGIRFFNGLPFKSILPVRFQEK